MIYDFYTTTFTVKRDVWTTDVDSNPYSAESTVGTFTGHIQQANAQLAASLGLSFTKTHSIWCAIGTDVKEGDHLTSASGSYTVRAKQTNNIGDNKHIELTVESDSITA